MKRFLILFILITFSVVSCAGPKVVPNQVGKPLFTKPDFSQDEYEKDREKCNRSIDENLDPYALHWQAFVDCLAKKGYTDPTSQDGKKEEPTTNQTEEDVEKTKKEPTTKERIITAGKTAGMVLVGVIAATLYLGLMFAPRK